MDHTVSTVLLVLFAFTTLLTLFLLAYATRSRAVILGSLAWLLLQGAISLTGFYTHTDTLPPRLLLALAPPMLLVLSLFILPAGKRFMQSMDLDSTILLHSVRIFVELSLYGLFLFKQVPALMTFEAGNLDILAGLTAPLLWWGRRRGFLGNKSLLGWNILCLLSLANIVVRALLSMPYPTQQFGLTQPNVAILYFPFVLLPAFIVPSVLFCHLAIFRLLPKVSAKSAT